MTSTQTPTHTYTYADLDRLLSLMSGDEKHDHAALSTLDVLWVLYRHVLRVDPRHPEAPDRDRFLLSKGHGPMAFYAVLAAHGFLTERQLSTFGGWDSPLGHHPDSTLIPGCEIGSGSLGHGLPLAVGTALGLRLRGSADARTVVLIGDAELQEGSNAEAVQYAAHARLGSLTCIVIDNDSASGGWRGGAGARFAAEGWSVRDVDGRDHEALSAALTSTGDAVPRCVVAHVEAKR